MFGKKKNISINKDMENSNIEKEKDGDDNALQNDAVEKIELSEHIENTNPEAIIQDEEKKDFEKIWLLSKEDFGPLWKYVADDDITDVDWDCDALWIRSATKKRERVDDPEVTSEFINNFIDRVAIHESALFNPKNKSFGAETETLRITCVHEEMSPLGRCVNIRKTLPRLRFTAKEALDNQYTTKQIMAFIVNCIKAKSNIVICGRTGSGKTETAKFFSSFIPKHEKVITVEDSKEWHYKNINPGADGIEFKVKSNQDYEEAISVALRLSPTWLMIAESRSREVVYLKESMTTGVYCITTLHTEDVRHIPMRMINMMGTVTDIEQELNDLYMCLGLGIHLIEKEDENGFIHREIDQVGYFDIDPATGKNRCYMIVSKGVLNKEEIPDSLKEKIMERAGIEDIYLCKELDERMQLNPVLESSYEENSEISESERENEKNEENLLKEAKSLLNEDSESLSDISDAVNEEEHE